MKRFILIFCATFYSAAVLSGCGGGGGGGGNTSATTATTKMYLFGTMSSASAGGSAGIMENVETTISALPAGVTLTSIVPSGTAALIPSGDASYDEFTRVITLLNSKHTPVVADTTINAGKGVEVATLTFSLTGGATPPIPTPGTDTTVYQYRTDSLGESVKELGGCIINFTTTYQ